MVATSQQKSALSGSLLLVVAGVVCTRASRSFIATHRAPSAWRMAPFALRSPAQLRPPQRQVAVAASGSDFELPAVEDSPENSNIAAACVFFVLGLVFPILHGFNVGLIFAGLGYFAASGGLAAIVAKTESVKQYANTAEQVGEYSAKAGGLGIQSYNWVRTKVNELQK
mmetsp:Transcript_15646/g.33282  ORF Transcript_15646/g.33282 Transcript_15646/m.33282 type:complete len:169 (-) Transcript_15646:72-578(-)